MRISAIQPNYVNRINFKQNESNTVSSPIEDTKNNKFANNNTQKAVTVGLGALAVIGLVYAGYRGKLGAKIQKLLGGVSDASKSAERNMSDASVSGTKPNVKPDNVNVKSNSVADVAEDSIVVEEVQPGKVFGGSDIEDVEFVEEVHKFLTPEEFKSLPKEELLKRVGADLDEISKTSNSFDAYDDAVENYFKKYGIVDIKDKEFVKEHVDILNVFMDVTESKFAEELAEKGELNDFKLGRAGIKYLMGEHDNAEKILMDVINDLDLGVDKVNSYISLKSFADESKDPERYFQIINKELEKDTKTAKELQSAAMEHVEKFGGRVDYWKSNDSDIRKFIKSKHYFVMLDRTLDDLSITSEKVPMRESIKSIIESNEEVEKVILGKAAN